MTLELNTLFGQVKILMSELDDEGKRSGMITACAFRDERSPSINAVKSMILAHACAGIDVESPAYIEGIETTLDAIVNNDDSERENPNEAEPKHRIITANTHEVTATIRAHYEYTESLNTMIEENEPMSVEEIEAWVLGDIVEQQLRDVVKRVKDYLIVEVKPIA